MIEKLTLKINGKNYKYTRGLTLEEISKDFLNDYKYPILIARVDNRIKELNSVVEENCEIEFLDLTSREGNRTHISGLTYLLLYVIKKMFGQNANIRVKHSIDKGIYIETNFKISEDKIKEIEKEMKKTSSADIPITRVTIDRLEAMEYFRDIDDKVKARVLMYNTNTYITLYRLGNLYDYFYNYMPVTTNHLKDFALTYINNKGFVLRFPTPYIKDKIIPYTHHEDMFKTYEEYSDWAKKIKVENSADLNSRVSTGKINDLIRIDETVQANKLLNVASQIASKKNKIKIVLIAGPSSSGKTTTSKKLCLYLQSFGLNPQVISMDDYFVEKKDNPIGEDGKPDYECLEALDLKLFDSQMADLLDSKKVKAPTYNFVLGKKEYNRDLYLGEDDILVIEGIHALDNKILNNIPREKKYKIYISPLTELNLDEHNRISTTDNRLLRRIIRDNRTRGYDVEKTLGVWPSVRAGEEKYIFPYQDEADYTFNSALIYEIGVLKTYVEPLLFSVPSDSQYYEEAKRLLNFLRLFLPIPSDAIEKQSIVREFIGGSVFVD